jgi:hypothetical protein
MVVATQKFAVTATLAMIETISTQVVLIIIPIPANLAHVENITKTINAL